MKRWPQQVRATRAPMPFHRGGQADKGPLCGEAEHVVDHCTNWNRSSAAMKACVITSVVQSTPHEAVRTRGAPAGRNRRPRRTGRRTARKRASSSVRPGAPAARTRYSRRRKDYCEHRTTWNLAGINDRMQHMHSAAWHQYHPDSTGGTVKAGVVCRALRDKPVQTDGCRRLPFPAMFSRPGTSTPFICLHLFQGSHTSRLTTSTMHTNTVLPTLYRSSALLRPDAYRHRNERQTDVERSDSNGREAPASQ